MSSTGLSRAPSSPSPTVYISEQPSSSRSWRLMGSTSSRRLGLIVILRLQHATACAVKEIDHGRRSVKNPGTTRSTSEATANRSATATLRMAARRAEQDSAWLETIEGNDNETRSPFSESYPVNEFRREVLPV